MPVAVALAAVGIAFAFLAGGLAPPDAPSPGADSRPAEVKQPPWRMTVHPAGLTRPHRRVLKRFRHARPALVAAIKDVYDTLFLRPEDRAAVLESRFTERAARALKRTRAGLPKGATGVRIATRRARVGIQVPGLSRAAASVRVGLTAQANKRIRLAHRATLWLERRRGGWRVIGFDIDQGRVK